MGDSCCYAYRHDSPAKLMIFHSVPDDGLATSGTVPELEERFRMLAEHVHDLISFHDLEGRFIYATPSALRLLGVAPESLIGTSVYDLVVPEDQQALRDAHRDILGNNGK